ncbi:MAG: class I SAM-dependent methyltransferase [Candidatus Niyogibacteria bacterium]|nr:class I SAM-dependent methyltransferase [Candidatus Niyogibacteria bacterium]
MKKKKREENPFEKKIVANEWVKIVEDTVHGGWRKKDVYPRLFKWSRQFKNKIIVEIGSGQGVCSSKINFRQNKYIGIEPSRWLLARARALYGHKRRKFLGGDAYSLPLRSKSADAAFSINVWFHLKNIKKACSELRRILKPLGEFYIITANPGAYEVWESFFTRYQKKGKMLSGEFYHPVSNLSLNIFYFHSLSDIVGAFEKNDLIIIDIETFSVMKKDTTHRCYVGIKGYAK